MDTLSGDPCGGRVLYSAPVKIKGVEGFSVSMRQGDAWG